MQLPAVHETGNTPVHAHGNTYSCPLLLFGAGLENMGMKLEDFQARMNPSGTTMGNLTRIIEVRRKCVFSYYFFIFLFVYCIIMCVT